MVAFGETIEQAKDASVYPASAYLDYAKLKSMIYDLQQLNLRSPVAENAMSLSMHSATNAACMPVDSDDEGERSLSTTHEGFLSLLDAELKKMDTFTHEEVVKVRKTLRELEAYSRLDTDETFSVRCSDAGAAFLEIEKYVNLNVTAVRKLLKKHDKVLPQRGPIKAFYTARMHDMRWVRQDYSDVVVRLSRLYASAESADVFVKQYDEQSFVRTTSKFWVKPGDLSAVKLAISKHLPVFVQPGMQGGIDSQLVNSVYLDSSTLELYHGRLAKSPGAVALRLRWYGTGEPTLVFVERKTHRDSWTGDESVKERFVISPEQVPALMSGEFDADAYEEASRAAGTKSEAAIAKERKLIDEISTLIISKRLVPTARSQCMRCAFQLEHTNAVRASVDTNLCLINEVHDGHWYRDPTVAIPNSELTRFPMAVLEIKLALSENDELPAWVRELAASNMLIPVHKFSKFIHGCAVLLPDEVQALPYWIDDPALADSIKASGAASLLDSRDDEVRPVRRRNAPTLEQQFQDADRHPEAISCLTAYRDFTQAREVAATGVSCDGGPCCYRDLDVRDEMQQLVPPQKIEPKLFLAAERTLIHWLHAAVVLTSLGAAGFAAASHQHHGARPRRSRATFYAGLLSLAACALAAHALRTFSWRLDRISRRAATEWADHFGPLVLAGLTSFTLSAVWIVELASFLNK